MLKELVHRGFRNLEDGRWQLGEGIHWLHGPNGAGKTSLLEAVYFLATTRSFRTAQVADCCRHGQAGFSVYGRLGTGGEENRPRADLEAAWSREGLERKVNGKVVPLGEHLAQLPVVAWAASDVELIDGGPAQRRRFVDQGVVSSKPGTIALLTRFRRALEQKRELLRTARVSPAAGVGEDQPLAAWNRVLAEAAAELIRFRAEYLGRLERALEEVRAASGLELPELGLEYRPSPAEGTEGPEALLAAFERLAGSETDAGRPLVGPHRDEIRLTWGQHEASRVASAGEKKLFGLLLARARGEVLSTVDRKPLYLLDDLDAELDRGRLERLLTLYSGAGQVLVTSSNERLENLFSEGTSWRLGNGQKKPFKPV